MGKVVRFITPRGGAKCGTRGVWCQGRPTRPLKKNLESRRDESKTVNWNFLQLRTDGVTYETSEVVRKNTKHTRIKRVEFDHSSVGTSCHILRSGTRETLTLMFPLVYPREYGGAWLAEPSSAPRLEFLQKFLTTVFFLYPLLALLPSVSTLFHSFPSCK
jgi:hypothetical protein